MLFAIVFTLAIVRSSCWARRWVLMPWLRRGKAWDVAAILIVTALAIMSLMPLYWMVSTAFTQPTLVVKMPPDLIPSRPTLHNFRDLFTRRLLGRWTLNSAIVAVSVTVAQLFVASLAGYAFAKKEFIGRNLLFWLYIGSMMVPGQSDADTPLHPDGEDASDEHICWADPALRGAPLGVFLMKQFMQTIPGRSSTPAGLTALRSSGCSPG